jgi:uncharacterized protein YggU (UPF0235/DUF167 family)
VRVTVKVRPGADLYDVGERYGTDETPVLLVGAAAPATGGRANAGLAHVLASAFGVARRAVTIAAGATGRSKVVEVSGADPALCHHRLPARSNPVVPMSRWYQ